MPTISNARIPEPKGWDEFEDITLSAMRIRWNSWDLSKHGRQGQKQNGVDIYGENSKGEYVGVQCKNTLKELTEALIDNEIKLAAKFTPKIARLYIATTAPRDAKIQKYVRGMSADRAQRNEFEIQVIFWDEIASDLSADQLEFEKHYPQFSGSRVKANVVDEAIYNELVKLLPSNGVIKFLDTNNFAGFPFQMSKLDPLYEFVTDWNDAEHEFLDETLEKLRTQLWEKAREYCSDISTNTWVCDSNLTLSSVPQEWEIDSPERFFSVVDSLHSQAKKIVETHQELVRVGRKHFNS